MLQRFENVVFWLVMFTIQVWGLPTEPNLWPQTSSEFGNIADLKFRSLGRRAIQNETVPPLLNSQTMSLCSDPRCSCTSTHSISCRCSPQDKEAALVIQPTAVPYNASHFVIDGCRSVIFSEKGIKHLPNLSSVTVRDVGEVVFQPGSINQAPVPMNCTVRIDRCRRLVIQTGAFASNPLSPVVFNAAECHEVQVSESAFNRLHTFSLDNIRILEMSSHAFRFANGGPKIDIKTDIIIQSSVAKEVHSFTFPSPLNRLLLDNVTILESIHPNATSALRIARLSINGSKIGAISTGAFSALTHLDSLELHSTTIKGIGSGAFASAASSLTITDCQIGRMNQSAVYMTAARIKISSNRIQVLATGALNLREWNELLIEDNTVQLVERRAFYYIGEPKHLEHRQINDSVYGFDASFTIRRNTFSVVHPEAFVFSAQALQLQLEGNQFKRYCDCHLGTWAAELTQISRRTEANTLAAFPSPLNSSSARDAAATEWNDWTESEALWLGSSFFNSSSCWLDEAAAECSNIYAHSTFLPMKNYTTAVCGVQHQPRMDHCVDDKRAAYVAGNQATGKEVHGQGADRMKVPWFTSDEDVRLVYILAGLVTVVLVMLILLSLVCNHRRRGSNGKTTQHQDKNGRGRAQCEDEENITNSSPLATPRAEKQLGSGVVSSGSISRLTVREYTSYLEELGPIYSEPSDPPCRDAAVALPKLAPPQLPAIPVEWTVKMRRRPSHDEEQPLTGESSEGIEIDKQSANAQTCQVGTGDKGVNIGSSLAHEFTQDMLAALKDKLDVSPTYSDVKDVLNTVSNDNLASGQAQVTVPSLSIHELYDLISVVDFQPKASTTTTNQSANKGYCTPAFQSLNKAEYRSSCEKPEDSGNTSSMNKPPEAETPLLARSLETGGDTEEDAYTEVASQPFSFSFRRPLLLQSKSSSETQTKTVPPPKPTRLVSPTLCDYGNPRDFDQSEPQYAELIVSNRPERRENNCEN